MAESRTINASRSIVWGTILKILTLLFPFISRTIIIYTIGIEYTGLGSLFTSILSVLSLAELGIGSALVFSMYKPIEEYNVSKVNALLNFYRKCYRVIGLIILGIGLCVFPLLKYLIDGEIPDGISLYVLFGVYLANTVLGYLLFAYKNSLFTANQRNDLSSKVLMISNMGLYITQIVLLLIFRNYYFYVFSMLPFTILNNILIALFTKKYFPQYRCEGKIEKEELEQIKFKVAGLILQKIGGIVLTSVDVVVISAFLGLKVLGIYNGYHYIVTSLFGFLAVMQTALVPGVANSIVKESKEKNLSDFRKFHFMYMWIVIWWCACLAGLYQPFIRQWQGAENMLGVSAVVLFCILFVTHKWGDMCYVYREAAGLWWQGKFVPLIAAVVNLVINLILINFIGLNGVMIATIVSLVCVYMPYGSYVLFKEYFNSMKEWRKYLLRLLGFAIVAAVTAITTYFLCELMPLYGWWNIILRGILCVFVPNIILLACYLKTNDFKNAFSFVKNSVLKKIFKRN